MNAAERYEIEQDQYLRSLSKRTELAETEAKEALIDLADCRKSKAAAAMLAVVATMGMATMGCVTAFHCNVF